MDFSNDGYEVFVIRLLRQAADTTKTALTNQPVSDPVYVEALIDKLVAEAEMRERRLADQPLS